MRRLWTATVVAAFVASGPALANPPWVVELDRKGTGFFPYWCVDAQITKATLGGATSAFVLGGTCDLLVRVPGYGMLPVTGVPLRALVSFDGAWATEAIEFTSTSKVHTRVRCEQDPFRFGSSSCLDAGAAVNVSKHLVPPLELYPPIGVPVMSAVATPEAIKQASTGQAKDPLKRGATANDLKDWTPFAEPPGGVAAVRIQGPASSAVLPAGSSYEVALARRERGAVAAVALQFERLEPAPKVVGDVALPADKTHWWQPKWSAALAWSQLPFTVEAGGRSHPLTEAGLYRVRARAVKAEGGYDGAWTDWRSYCVGTAGTCGNIAQLSRLGADTLQAVTRQFRTRVPILRPPAK